MAIIPTNVVPAFSDAPAATLLAAPLAATNDLFEVLNYCTGLVNVLLETDEHGERMALCGRLAHALELLTLKCDEDLPPYLIDQLSALEPFEACIPDCWQDTATMLGYVQALTRTLLSNTQSESDTREITGLLHDMIYLLDEQLREPFVEG